MPRVSKVQAEANHQAIEAAASRLFRERGLHGVTVAEVMAEAGLTHGGFYAHYPSKDALAASACERAFAFAAEKWRRRIDAAATPRAARHTIAERYLRAANCDPSVGVVSDGDPRRRRGARRRGTSHSRGIYGGCPQAD